MFFRSFSSGWLASVSALWLLSPFALLMPIVPWTISARLGPPIEPEDLFGEGDEEEVLEAARVRVVAEIQRLVTDQAAGR